MDSLLLLFGYQLEPTKINQLTVEELQFITLQDYNYSGPLFSILTLLYELQQ